MAEPDSTPNGTERPDWCPEKYWDPESKQVRSEDMGKSLTELERMYTATTQELAALKKNSGDDAPGLAISRDANALPDDADVKAVLTKAGLDQTEVAAHFREHGKLSDVHYAALRKLGYPPAVVNSYLKLESQYIANAQAQMHDMAVKKAGGEKQLETLLSWAGANLSDPDLQTYNRLVNDPQTAAAGVAFLIDAYNQAVGQGNAQPLAQGEGGLSGGGAAFKSQREMQFAIQDERYSPQSPKHDEQYYNQVRARLAATEIENLPAR